jgi:hypothetical protein
LHMTNEGGLAALWPEDHHFEFLGLHPSVFFARMEIKYTTKNAYFMGNHRCGHHSLLLKK